MVNREALWQLLRMYDVDGKLLNGIKSIYVNSLTCIRVKGGEGEYFRIDSGCETGEYHVPLSYELDLRQTSTLQGLYIAVATHN